MIETKRKSLAEKYEQLFYDCGLTRKSLGKFGFEYCHDGWTIATIFRHEATNYYYIDLYFEGKIERGMLDVEVKNEIIKTICDFKKQKMELELIRIKEDF